MAPNFYFIFYEPCRNNCLLVFYIKCALGLIVISVSIILPACTSEVEKVCKVSDEDNLQPFKDMMDNFLAQGNWPNCHYPVILSYWTYLHLTVYVQRQRSAPVQEIVCPLWSEAESEHNQVFLLHKLKDVLCCFLTNSFIQCSSLALILLKHMQVF